MLPLVLLALACLCDARPQMMEAPSASFGVLGIDNYIIGGQDADPGEWPWQLSQERASGSSWSHSCGASLLSETKALSAGHCPFGTPPDSIRVVAGLHDRSDQSGAQIADCSDYTIHEEYNSGGGIAYANDISILNLATSIAVGGNVALLTLPPDDSDQFTGATCTLTGWGRDSGADTLPLILQEVEIEVLDTATCDAAMAGVIGAGVWDSHICFFDQAEQEGSCNGDSGGPGNCPDGSGGFYVAGVTSWGVSSGGDCMQSYPSVYTRTSKYLDWIGSH